MLPRLIERIRARWSSARGAARTKSPAPPLLSVLIAGTPSRVSEYGLPLFRKLEGQCEGLPVELLYFVDNKRRSVGLKRQALLDIARGNYVAFCDDDDDVADEYIREICAAARQGLESATPIDVITFDQRADVDGEISIVNARLGQANDRFRPGGITRRGAWHFCGWRREIAQRCRFPDTSADEDWRWARQCSRLARREHHIDKVLHHYRFRRHLTEASNL